MTENHLDTIADYLHQLIKRPNPSLPIQAFHCRNIQSLHKVHFYQPTLLLVLQGTKRMTEQHSTEVNRGEILLVSEHAELAFSNIPDQEYLALVLCFEPSDFLTKQTNTATLDYTISPAPESLLHLLSQLVQLQATPACPDLLLNSRRQELASILTHLKLDTSLRCPHQPDWRTRVACILANDVAKAWNVDDVSGQLAVSSPTLRRHLANENTGFRELLEDLRLTKGLGLVQTTRFSINQIALECGYQSPSRFSERFKLRFKTTPRELRRAQH